MSTRKNVDTAPPPFKFQRSRKWTRIYECLNHRYFSGTLPHVVVGWCVFPSYLGATLGAYCTESMVVMLSHTIKRVGNPYAVVWNTLLHEMIHVKIVSMESPHGRRFQKEMERLKRRGAFDFRANITY